MIIKDASSGELKRQFSDFVRKMEKEGKAGSYIVKFKHAIKNWLNFNDVTASFNGINIAGEYENPTLINERVPSKDELSRILRKATSRGKVSISIMAFSGFR
ncbi:integrase/recombinase, partial [mine drainage metagenome]